MKAYDSIISIQNVSALLANKEHNKQKLDNVDPFGDGLSKRRRLPDINSAPWLEFHPTLSAEVEIISPPLSSKRHLVAPDQHLSYIQTVNYINFPTNNLGIKAVSC